MSTFTPHVFCRDYVSIAVSVLVVAVVSLLVLRRPFIMSKNRSNEEHSKSTRIAIVNSDKCKPSKCSLECSKCCPVNRQGKLCIEVSSKDTISKISDELCIGCALCVKKCPYGAIKIINLPTNLDKETVHRYGMNSFKLHRLPLPRPGQVLGLVGANGTGKSTALTILKGKIKPNLGRYRCEPSWEEILRHFRGSELQAYFQHMLESKMRVLLKPQYVDQVPKISKGEVGPLIAKSDERGVREQYMKLLDLEVIADRSLEKLSGGELQRFTIGALCVQNASVYMFDEPSSYLDVRQRLTAARAIRSLLKDDNYVIVVEHDLSIVDYMSDFVCVLYGVPGVYGVVTMPYGVREGINIFLDGFVPTENLRFREEGLTFRIVDDFDEITKRGTQNSYPNMVKKLGDFTLTVESGTFSDSEIIVLLGENGCGKTTYIRMLAGQQKPDNGAEIPQLSISYKPQKIAPKFQGTVKDLLQTKIYDAFSHPQFQTDVLKPMAVEELYDQEVQNLSGGQLQRVGLCIALGTPANIYLIDEPSAYLDSDQRIIASRVIKRFIMHTKRTAFVVEHDFIMATYLADRVIVFEGTPAANCKACTPCGLLEGMNKFLKHMEITFRRDPDNFRPRINKHDSVKDREQKSSGNYFYMTETQPTNGHGAQQSVKEAEGAKKQKKGDKKQD
ncbi:putative Fer4 like domain [Trypanosoma vivax]|uniref:Putative ribonuclease L inhibitor n=1 Tax=Trypanosoma vivax (strain Y486) TaxID=1055687 RepID=G0U5G2_TRYVY|nr:putative Fer4 like domain [Trypanosoma vivax]CCC51112.1 putative ribonuclease L inhibitor [Trypanosoma vivax Y486]